jgi:hypothetical protein
MSAGDRKRYVMRDKQMAAWVGSFVATLEPGWSVTIAPPGRTPPQNNTFHDLCDDIAKARPEWNGLKMTADDWKQMLVLSHAMATDGSGVRLAKDLEGHGLIQLRESTARMSKARATSLIDYTVAWATSNNIPLKIASHG